MKISGQIFNMCMLEKNMKSKDRREKRCIVWRRVGFLLFGIGFLDSQGELYWNSPNVL